jgi:type I restriction enzyme S subunit
MQLAGMAASTDMAPYLSLRDQLRLRISYPSNKSQRAIASILIALDDKIDLNRRMDETLEEMAWAIFDETRQISNWPEIPLRALVEIFDGPHATPKLTDNGPIFLGIFNLANGRIDLGIANRLSEDDFNRWTQRVQPRAGDLVFSYETRLGQAALIPSGLRCCLGRRMGLLRIKLGEISPAVLLRVYLATQFQEVLRQRTIHGSTADRIPLSELGSFPIRVPRGAQEKALSFLLSPLQERCDTNEREAESLAAMRDLLLPKLMSGEIRVRDAEHQQESVL